MKIHVGIVLIKAETEVESKISCFSLCTSHRIVF
jgi:hypothetical protein